MSNNQFHFLKTQTHILKVHMNCQGCLQRVRKVLKRIEGVYKVDIDGEEQKVTVTGNVDSTILIKKLVKLGKHAELWPSNSSKQDHEGELEANYLRKNKHNQMELDATNHPSYTFQNQYMLPTLDREFNNRSLVERYYLDQESGMSSSFRYNPVTTTTAAQKTGVYSVDGKRGNRMISMAHDVVGDIQGYQFDRVVDDVNVRDYRFGIFPEFHYAN